MIKISKKSKQKINNFILTNKIIRRITLFFNKNFIPNLKKGFLLLILLFLIFLLAIKYFKPLYFDRIYSKSFFYFYHYLQLDRHNFSQINIKGNIHVRKSDIISIINKSQPIVNKDGSVDYEHFISNLITKIKTQIPWVDQITIIRTMPNILNIVISEYKPFAIWQNIDDKYFTDKDGNLVPYQDIKQYSDMVILSGKEAHKNAKSLFNIFAIDPVFSANVYSATWISQRRWDIRLKNGLLVKLPQKDIANAWHSLIKIYNSKGSNIGLKVIDLRISDKIYLEYEDSMIKELKNL